MGLVVSFVVLTVGVTADLLDHEQLRYELSEHYLQEVRAGLEKYRAGFGRYPSAAEGLAALRADPVRCASRDAS